MKILVAQNLPAEFGIVESVAPPRASLNDGSLLLWDMAIPESYDGSPLANGVFNNLALEQSRALIGDSEGFPFDAQFNGTPSGFSVHSDGGLVAGAAPSPPGRFLEFPMSTNLKNFVYASGVQENQPELAMSIWMRSVVPDDQESTFRIHYFIGDSAAVNTDYTIRYRVQNELWIEGASSGVSRTRNRLYHIVITPTETYIDGTLVGTGVNGGNPFNDWASYVFRISQMQSTTVIDSVFYRMSWEDLNTSGRTAAALIAEEQQYVAGNVTGNPAPAWYADVDGTTWTEPTP